VRVSAVIVNYNAGPALVDAVRSLQRDPTIDWQIVVVDNASSDGSADALSVIDGVRVLRNATNVGFGSGVNQGVRETGADLVLVMNPDCVLDVGACGRLASVLARHPDCAIAGPRILDPDGGIQGSARGDPDMFTGVFGRTSVLQRLVPGSGPSRRNVVRPELASTEDGVVVDWLSGACVLVRRRAFDEVGGFDEGYFLYWEDADLCRRLRGRGLHVRYVPSASAVHQVGRSSRTARRASIRAFHDSAYRYYATHVAPGAWNPRRVLARCLLSARCWWRLRASD